jgi:hypothetical protein
MHLLNELASNFCWFKKILRVHNMNWMIFVHALILTVGVAVMDVFFSQVRRIWWYLLLYGMMFLGVWLFESKAEASELTIHAQMDIEWLSRYDGRTRKSNNETDIEYFKKELQFHKDNAIRTCAAAKERCWWLPKLDERKSARYCWTSAMAMAVPGTPEFKLGAVILNVLLEYGLDCSEEWNYIDNKLYWCKYHTEMVEFYEDILKKSL